MYLYLCRNIEHIIYIMDYLNTYLDDTIISSPELKSKVKSYLCKYFDSNAKLYIYNGMLLFRKDVIKMSNDLPKTFDISPIEEWTHLIIHNQLFAKIIFGHALRGITYLNNIYWNYLFICEVLDANHNPISPNIILNNMKDNFEILSDPNKTNFKKYLDTNIKSSDELKNLVHEYLTQYCTVDSSTLIIHQNELIGLDNDISYPDNIPQTYDFHPIEEWTHEIYRQNYKAKIVFGFDWFGIRHCSDPYGSYILIEENLIQ